MGGILAIFLKEVRSYFGSPIGYVMAAVYLLFSGLIFRNLILEYHQFSLSYEPRFAGGAAVNANAMVVTHLFSVRYFVWLVVVPMLTMRLYAEEKKSGTMELLLTSPITAWQTLIGKFSACLCLFAFIEALGFGFLLLLASYAVVDWGPVASGYLATFLLGSTFISAGLLASSLTDNQIVASVLSFFLLILLCLIEWSAQFVSRAIGEIIKSVSLLARMEDMNRGVIDSSDVIFFVSAVVLFLYVTHTAIESRRWRQ